MLPTASRREIEVSLAKLLVDTASSLAILMSPTGHVFAWQGTGTYDAAIQSQGDAHLPVLDPDVRRLILKHPTQDSTPPREYGSWVAPDLLLWLLSTTTSTATLQKRTSSTVNEVRTVLRKANFL